MVPGLEKVLVTVLNFVVAERSYVAGRPPPEASRPSTSIVSCRGTALPSASSAPGLQCPGDVQHAAQHRHPRLGVGRLDPPHDLRAVPVGEHEVHYGHVEGPLLVGDPEPVGDGGGDAELGVLAVLLARGAARA
jgi:hypothetical protein